MTHCRKDRRAQRAYSFIFPRESRSSRCSQRACYGGWRIRRRRLSQLFLVYGSTAPANSPTTRFMHCSSRLQSRASCFSSRAAMPCLCSDYPKFLRRGSPRAFARSVKDVHEVLANALAILACLHAAAALVHHWVFRDRTLVRMLPGSKR